jgi:hypothetical protein
MPPAAAPPTGGGGKATDTQVLALQAKFDASAVASEMQKLSTKWGKQMRNIERQSDRSMKGTGKAVKEFMWQMGGARKAYDKLYERQTKSLKGIKSKWRDANKEVIIAKKEIGKLAKTFKSETLLAGPGGLSEDDLAKHEDQLKEAKKKLDAAQRKEGKLRDAKAETRGGIKEIKEKMTFDSAEMFRGLEEAGEEVSDLITGPLEALASKDIPGAFKKGAKLFEGVFSLTGKATKSFSKGFGNLGSKLLAKGMDLKSRGMGGRAGAAKMGGMALKGVGAIGDKLGGMMSALAKLGPILTGISAFFVGIIKLLIDSEAQAKEFNKSILSTAGSAEFLSQNLGDSYAAGQDLRETLKQIRDQANSLDNMDWGINKETHTAVLNALTAEGVGLKKLDDDFHRVGKSAESATGYAKDWGSTVQMSVAYSRAFGVSLQEIGQLQGEMMTELGMNLDAVEGGFQQMIRGAADAGIATNKFFAIIRGFSADLTLFNIRLEDVTKTMVMLGRAMSPREAQKMLQGLSSMFKGRSLIDRTKDVMLAGPGARKAMQAQQEAGTKALAEDTGIDLKDLQSALKMNNADLGKWIAKKGKKLSQDQTNAIFEASIMEGKLASKNTIDTASAIKDANPWTAKKILELKIASLTGGKKIEELTGLERVVAGQAGEVSDEQLDQFAKLAKNTEAMKAGLMEKLEQSNGDATKFTDDEQKLLKKLGVNIKDGTTYAKLDKATSETFYTNLGKTQKELLDGSKEAINYEKKISDVQTSLLTRLEVLVDFIMNQIYNLLDSMLDVIDWHGKHATERQMNKLLTEAMKTGDKEVIEAIKKNGDPTQAAKDMLQTSVGKSMTKDLIKERKAVLEALSPEDLLAAMTRYKATEEAKKTEAPAPEPEPDETDTATAAAPYGPPAPPPDPYAVPDWAEPTAEPAPAAPAGPPAPAPAGPPAPAPAGPPAPAPAGPPEPYGPIESAPEPAPAPPAPPAPAAPAEPPAPGGLAGAAASDTAAQIEDMAEDTSEHGSTLKDVWNALRVRGIKLDKPFLQNNIKKVFRDATYEAASDALTDYYLMSESKMSAKAVADAVKKGINPGAFIRAQLRAGKDFKTVTAALSAGGAPAGKAGGKNPAATAPAKAAGGVVGAIRDGMAILHPAPGEGLTSIGRGEKIEPAGRGGGRGGGAQVIELRLKGDLARIIDARSHNAIAEHERMRSKR